MRQFFMAALSAMLLAGCGAQGVVPATYQAPSSRLAAKAQAPFVQVLNHEDAVQEAVTKAFSAWAMPQKLSFPMKPDNRVREALGVHAGAAAVRALAGGEREVIGWAMFTAGRPHSFEHFSATRAFRMVLKPDGTVRSAKLEGETLDETGIMKPDFAPVDETQAASLKRRLEGFLHEPAQASWLKTYLWTAIAGAPTTHTYELHAVTATSGNFGAFGRIARFRGTLKRDGKPMPGYTNFEIEVVTDRSGRVIAAGDPTRP
ncbi:hypothetical protein D3C72_687870 [compost metagenome]